jgi:hypothetical protein
VPDVAAEDDVDVVRPAEVIRKLCAIAQPAFGVSPMKYRTPAHATDPVKVLRLCRDDDTEVSVLRRLLHGLQSSLRQSPLAARL